MSGYLLALDDMCEHQYVQVRRMITRAEVAEARWRRARVELAKAEAHASHAESLSLPRRKNYSSKPTIIASFSEACTLWNGPKERSVTRKVSTRLSWRESRCLSWPALLKECASQYHPLRQHCLVMRGPMARKF
jgi:hypothetical protein